MTNSFLSNNSFKPQASPVDTYVRPSQIAPQTGFDQLVNALVTVNPSLNALVDSKIKEKIREEQAEGIKIAEQEALTGFKKVVKNVKENDGNDLANQLIGGSIFADNAYQKQKAFLLGTKTYENVFGIYQGKTFEIEVPDGEGGVKKITKPIHHFDVTSPQFTSLINDFSVIGENKLVGIKPEYQESYYKAKAKAIEEITKHHITENSKYKVERQKGFLESTLFSNWIEFDKGNIDGALETTQGYIETTVNLGLSDAVTADNIWAVAKNQASRIFQITEKNGGNGYEEVEKYFDFISQIKYGPKELQKDGSFKQRTIGDAKAFDILDFKVKLGDQSDKLLTRQLKKVEAAEDFTIEEMTKKYATDNTVLERLLELFPNRREFLFEQIEIYAGNRDERFEDFNSKVGTGYYLNNRQQMYSDLRAIKAEIGETFTEEDQDNYKLSFEIARRSVSSNVGRYDTRTQRIFKQGKSILGNEGIDLNTYTDKTFIEPHVELMRRIEKRVIDEISNVDGLSEKDRETIFREIEKDYFDSLKQIKAGTYLPPNTGNTGNTTDAKGDGNTTDANTETDIRKAGIQQIVDDYGFSSEIATQIYDYIQQNPDSDIDPQQLYNRSFNSNAVETKETLSEEKSWGQMMREAILKKFPFFKKEDKDELVSQLNNVKENLGENESATGVIDSVLNALMGSVTAGDLKDNLNIYTVKEGDNLSTIADQFSINLDDLIEANDIKNPNLIQPKDKLIIPPPRRDVLSEYKGKAIPDFGGLAELIISGESIGHGSYNAFNKQSEDGKITPGTMDITSKTIAEMEQLQASGKVFAVGAYQFTPGVLAEAREYAGIEADAIMTPAVQDRLLWGMLLSGKKKAAITDYLLGESDDLRAAHEALAREFAALEGPDGVGIYDDDDNNLATIKAAKVKETLIKARKAISNK